jgi:hypothetical protein
MECVEGSSQPLRGWVGAAGDNAVPAPFIEFRYPSRESAVVSAVLLWPFQGSRRPPYQVRGAEEISRGAVHHLEIKHQDGAFDHVAWSTGLALPVDDARPFLTDAPFVWQRTPRGGTPLRTFRLGGTYLRKV